MELLHGHVHSFMAFSTRELWFRLDVTLFIHYVERINESVSQSEIEEQEAIAPYPFELSLILSLSREK